MKQRADAAAALVAWVIEYGREQREQAALEQRRRDMAEEMAFIEWLMTRRPEPVAEPERPNVRDVMLMQIAADRHHPRYY